MLKPELIVEKLSPLNIELVKERQKMISEVSYNLYLDMSSSEPTQSGICTLSFIQTKTSSSSVQIDFKGQEISSLLVNSSDVSKEASWKDDKISIPATHFIQGTNNVEVHYLNRYSKTSNGLYRQEDPKDKGVYIYTDLEPYFCHTFVPCFDQPSIKATLDLKIKTVKSATNIANAPIQDEVVQGEFKTTSFQQCPKISTQLFALVSGPYVGKTHTINQTFEGKEYSVPIGLQSRGTMTEWINQDDWFTKSTWALRQMVEYFHFPFPFAKYDNVFVPNYNMGAMENVGLVTFTENQLQQSKVKVDALDLRMYNTTIHEMSHQWFGNLVTMHWWDDLWLNEAFATFIAQLMQDRWEWKEKYGTPQLGFNTRKNFAYNADRLTSTHAVANSQSTTEEAEDSFDSITQGKGSSVIRQLFYNIGDESFKKAIREQFQKQQWGNTQREDFLNVMAKHTSFDVLKQGNEWICSPGLNGVQCKVEMDGDKCKSFEIHQQFYTHEVQKSFQVPIKVFFKDNTSKVLKITVMDQETTKLEELVGTDLIGQLFNQEDNIQIEYMPSEQDINFVNENQELIKDESVDLKSLDEAILNSIKSLKLKVNTSQDYFKFRFMYEKETSISVNILANIKDIITTQSIDTEEAIALKNKRNDEMIKLITTKFDKNFPSNTKQYFDQAKFFMYSEEHMAELEGQLVNQDFVWFEMGNSDQLSICSKILMQKCVSMEKKEKLIQILEERLGVSNELKKLKILLFSIKADKEDLYQLLKGNLMDKSNKYQEECKDQDQHEYTYCLAGLISKVNEDSEWAKELTHKKLWDDLIEVAALLEQGKFKKFYQNLISYKGLNQELLDRVKSCLKKCKEEAEPNMVLEKCLSNTTERMAINLKIIEFNK